MKTSKIRKKTYYKMEEKYILIQEFTCDSGTLPEGTEIVLFRGMIYVNGGPIPSVYNDIFLKLIRDPKYVRKQKITANEF